MQVLKENIRERIDIATIKLFKKNGFEKVSMRKIAEEAEMTVGNIYRYYDNKNHLFTSILQPTLDEILALLDDEISDILDTPEQNYQFVSNIISIFLEIHKRHSDVLDILVHNFEGDHVINPAIIISELLVIRMENLIVQYANNNHLNIDSKFLAKLLCDGIIDNFIRILYKFDNDEDRRIHMIQITQVYTQLFISGIMSDRREV